MLRYKSDLTIEANGGTGKVSFRATRIEAPCVITSPNIEALTQRVEQLASSNSGAIPDEIVREKLDTYLSSQGGFEDIRGTLDSLVRRQAELERLQQSEDAIQRKIDAAIALHTRSSPQNQNATINARLNTVSDEIARIHATLKRIDERLRALESSTSVGSVGVVVGPGSILPGLETPASTEEAPSSAPASADSSDLTIKRITTPDGRVITLRRTPQATKVVNYAW